MAQILRKPALEIRVNLQQNKYEVIRRHEGTVFREDGRFILESDEYGYSYLERRAGKYFFVNVLEDKVIQRRELSEKEAQKWIEDALYARIMGEY